MKYIIALSLVLLNFLNCFGDTTNTETGNTTKCVENKYDLVGNYDLKVNTNSTFTVKSNTIGENNTEIEIKTEVKKDGEIVTQNEGDKFNLSFEGPGIYDINTQIKEKTNDCAYNLSKKLHIYSKTISYISDKEDFNLSFDNNFYKNDIFFNKIYIENKNTSSIQDTFLSTITDKLYIFQDSDLILINSSNYLDILQGFEKLSKIYNVNFPNKKIFIITDSSFIMSKKILSSFINSMGVVIYTFPPNNVLNFLNYVSTGKPSTDLINVKEYGINKISFDESSSKILFLTNIINKLISSGFPIGILGIILSLSVAVTAINFIRQFIGFAIFSLYYPLFIALSIYVFSFELTLVLLTSSFLSVLFMKIINKKINFLLNTKLSLFFIFYLIFTLIIIGILNSYDFINFYDFKTNLIIFPFSIIPMVIYKVFSDNKKIFSLSSLFYLFEFVFVSVTAYLIIKSNFIQSLLLSYTELLIAIFLINLLIGRFTGLQLLEYIRFIPLIKRHFQEE
ncbi:MAG: 7TM domain-containing protein [Candidatus Gracilibacteria bacterium]|nr:7TM domain-containing protein [Candidatus Gracilibacteria bacterium]